MVRMIGLAALMTASACATAQTGTPKAAPIVHFDVAGPAEAGQGAFYEKLFGWRQGPGGTVSVPVNGASLTGTIRTDPAEKMIYIGVPDVAATLAAIQANGGRSIRRFAVPGVAIIGQFTDPAGNRMGLVELTAEGRVKVP
jgi:uncharacterized protein